MEITKTVYISDRKEWREWLEQNFDKEKEIWLIYAKKSSGKPRILYNDAVEEALCFGWIDSTSKAVDYELTAQRYSPRNAKSTYSQANKERLRWLAEQKMLHPAIEQKVQHILNEEFTFPADIIDAIKQDETAWANYQTFSESYKRIRIGYIDGARERPEEFRKRLRNFIDKTREGKLLAGFGGIDKYY
jgi:uncharacterized protein YdeI (YjbR/CyaY-like superfamily)